MDAPELEKIAKANERLAMGWFERHLNWIIAVGCFVAGAITGHLV